MNQLCFIEREREEWVGGRETRESCETLASLCPWNKELRIAIEEVNFLLALKIDTSVILLTLLGLII